MMRDYTLMLAIVDDLDIEANQAQVIDSFGKRHQVQIAPHRGIRPRVGESWILDRSLGYWTFAAALQSIPPEIEGSDGGNTGIRELLSALDSMGLIVNLVEEGGAIGEGEEFIIPAGVVFPWAGSSAPQGFLFCHGQAVSRETFHELFEEIGTIHGVGDGETTFNVPDIRQRFILGRAESGTGSVLGATGGAIDHTHSNPTTATSTHSHTISNTSSVGHTHTNPSTSSVGHTHTNPNTGGIINTTTVDRASGTAGTLSNHAHAVGNTGNTNHSHTQGNTGNANHSHTVPNISNTGSHSHTQGASGSSNPPYIVLNHIIATSALRGQPGPTGEDGSIWITGSELPEPEQGTVGDHYLQTGTGLYFEKTGFTTWTFIGNLTGPQGDTGATGADGADGVVQSIVAGANINVDSSDPANPIVSSTGGGGTGDAGVEDILMLGGM